MVARRQVALVQDPRTVALVGDDALLLLPGSGKDALVERLLARGALVDGIAAATEELAETVEQDHCYAPDFPTCPQCWGGTT